LKTCAIAAPPRNPTTINGMDGDSGDDDATDSTDSDGTDSDGTDNKD
jgi:hypothetical protein